MPEQISNPKKGQLERWRGDGYKEGLGPGTSGQVVQWDANGVPQVHTLTGSELGAVIMPAATSFTPTLSSTGGSAPGTATALGWWFQVGKMLWVEYSLTITVAAPATGYITATLPNSLTAVRSQYGVHGREGSVTGKAIAGNANSTTVTFYLMDNNATAVNTYGLIASGWVEVS